MTSSNLLPKQIELLSNFEEELFHSKAKKIHTRKDAMLLCQIKEKYDKISASLPKTHQHYNDQPSFKNKQGQNIFDLSREELNEQTDIYEIALKDLKGFDLDFLSGLPNLKKLSIKFSSLNIQIEDYNRFYFSLSYLDLSFNNLTEKIFDVLHAPNLKFLNLTGNFIKCNIQDMSALSQLEILNLSHNKLESYYLNTHIVEEEFKSENLDKSLEDSCQEKEKFERLQKFIQTNMQEFYHKLSALPSLRELNLSHNKIHFFDINPFYLQETSGFPHLTSLDISHNLIEDEVGILLVMNLPKIEAIDITNNPLEYNQTAYKNVEFEIFKKKNLLLINNKEEQRKKTKTTSNDDFEFHSRPSYVNEKVKLVPASKFDKKVKGMVHKLTSKIREIENNLNGKETDVPEKEMIMPTVEALAFKSKDSSIFLTHNPTLRETASKETKPTTFSVYDKFLIKAKNCLGKERHYKEKNKLNLNKAYQKLRYMLNTFKTDLRESAEDLGYMKPTISKSIHISSYVPNKDNFKNEFKIMSKLHKSSSLVENSLLI